MIDDITPERIAVAIKMDVSFHGVFLLVEGQRDMLFFNKFINQENCQIYITNGKKNLLGAITILNRDNFNRALSIADKDFDDILGLQISEKNLIYTDFHDLEIAIIESPALENILQSFSSKEKMEKICSAIQKDIRTLLYELTYDLGILKLANKIHELGLVFKPLLPDGRHLNFSKFIDFSTCKCLTIDELIKTVKDYSVNRQKVKSDEIILKSFYETKKNKFDKYNLCNGHDLCFVLQLALKKNFGSKIATETSPTLLEINLINAYDSTYFQQTQLYSQIKIWETANNTTVLWC